MISIFLVLVLLFLFLWKTLYQHWWRRGLEARLYFPEKTAYAGTQAELTEVLSNYKKLPLAEVELGFRVPKGILFQDAENIIVSDFVYKRDIFSLRGMEAVTRRYRMNCEKRGRYPISQVTLRTWSFFHLSRYGTESDGTDELTVYAKRTDVSHILSFCNTISGIQESTKKIYEDPFTFASVREYSSADPMKNINWKASARMNGLMVNTFSSVRSEQFFLFLDVAEHRIWREEQLTELGISAAATLSQKLICKGLEAGLAVNTDPPALFSPGRARERLRQIEYFLTEDFSEKKMIGLEELVAAAGKPTDRICVFISREWEASLLEKLRKKYQMTQPFILVTPVREDGAERLKVRAL